MSFKTFQICQRFLPTEPGKGGKDAPSATEEPSTIQMQYHTACSIVRDRVMISLNKAAAFYKLREVHIFVAGHVSPERITPEELYDRIENAVNGKTWGNKERGGLNKSDILTILKENEEFLLEEKMWDGKKSNIVTLKGVLEKLWHKSIQHRQRWNALKLRALSKKDRLIDSWENFLIYVYAPYFWKTLTPGNEITRYIIRGFDRRLPEWQLEPELIPYLSPFIYLNWELLAPCFREFIGRNAKNPIESREGDLLTQQMKHLVAVLDRSNTSYIDNDESKKLEILGYGIVNDVLIIDGKLKISTCFVTGKPSNGVGDHLYPILNAWKITGRCGSNSPWNLLPVISSINKGYTRINIQDIEGGKHTAVDLEVTKVTRVYTTDHPEGLPVDEFMSRITGANYNEKKGLINYVDMEELILSEKEEWTEPPSPGICILKPPQREKKQHKQVLIVPKEQLVLLGIKEEWSSNYVLSEPLDIWMKVYLWRKYVKEERTANLSYSVSPEVHKNLLGVLRSSFMSIAEGTQKIIGNNILE